jgi:PTH1 family peptidyl-tRNA hydrolase
MKLIVGLGNPGDKYKNNRHNVGYILVDKLVFNKTLKGTPAKNTNVFMNSSGEVVKKMCAQYGIDTPELWVIHDDLDIPLGSYKIQKGKGPKLHYGISSIEKELNSSDFWRVRVGVDNRISGYRIPGEEYVLQDFNKEEREILDKVLNEICKRLEMS